MGEEFFPPFLGRPEGEVGRVEIGEGETLPLGFWEVIVIFSVGGWEFPLS